MVTRQEQKEKRRQDILVAALDLFIHKGYTATKISDIAEAVGMSTGLLFHYFESKEKLYEELIVIGASGPQSVKEMPYVSPLEYFEQVTAYIFAAMESSPFVASMFVFMSQARYNDSASDKVKELLEETNNLESTIKIIKQGQKEGTIRKGNPEALTLAYWSAIQGIAEELAHYPEAPRPESTWIVDLVRKR